MRLPALVTQGASLFFHGNGHLPSHFYNNSAKHKIIFVIFDDVMTSKLT